VKPVFCHSANLAKHGVREEEVRQCLAGKHLKVRNPAGGKGTYLVIGKTSGGRYPEVAFEERGDSRWVFHAMPARPRLVRLLRANLRRHGREEG
jgi:hypothetical protein